jgi:endonuclease III
MRLVATRRADGARARAAACLANGAARRLARIDKSLDGLYPEGERSLDNKAAPLDEAVFIILTFQTDVPRAQITWNALRAKYPRWDALAAAPDADVAETIQEGGLQHQKARTIKKLLSVVREAFGTYSLSHLAALPAEHAERILTRLPGLSWKGARCVLLYSLGHPLFPVDSNTFRILSRAGVLRRDAVYRRRSLHDALQAAVPGPRRRALHVNLVMHGHRVCLPTRPHCSECPFRVQCPTGRAHRRAATVNVEAAYEASHA